MANYRQKKKADKKRLQVEIQKHSRKKIDTGKMSYNQLKAKEAEIKKREQYRNDTRSKKLEILEKDGFDRSQFKKSDLDKISLSDLKSGIYNIGHVTIKPFDFDKIYTLKDGEVLQIAFRDFAGETSLAEILGQYMGLNPDRLIDIIRELNDIKPTYTKGGKKGGKKGDSSGAAGDYKFLCGSQAAAVANRYERRLHDKRKPKRKWLQTDGSYKGYQFIKTSGKTYSNEITPRTLLEITCAIMSNVTEWDRVNFYKRVYYDLVTRHIPDLLKYLPVPQ